MHCCHDNSNVIVLPSSMKELECPRLLRLFFLLTVISQPGTYQLLIIPWGVTTIINRHFFEKVIGSLYGNAIFEKLVQ